MGVHSNPLNGLHNSRYFLRVVVNEVSVQQKVGFGIIWTKKIKKINLAELVVNRCVAMVPMHI